MTARRFTPKQEPAVIRAYEQGASLREVAQSFNCSPAAVQGVLERRLIERRRAETPPRLLIEEAEQREVVRRYEEEGVSTVALAKEWGCSRDVIRRVLAENGVVLREHGAAQVERHRLREEQESEIERRYLDGESQTVIAANLGISQSRVSRILRTRDVDTRRKGPGGRRHGRWKGGRIYLHDYIGVWVDPTDSYGVMRNSLGYVLEHRLVMARHLGRPLTSHETVHHKNSDRADNRLGNLQLRDGKHGKGRALRCADCGSRNIVPIDLD